MICSFFHFVLHTHIFLFLLSSNCSLCFYLATYMCPFFLNLPSCLLTSVCSICSPNPFLSQYIPRWHLFTAQATGCLRLSSVIWLLPCTEWGPFIKADELVKDTQTCVCRETWDIKTLTKTECQMIMKDKTILTFINFFFLEQQQQHIGWKQAFVCVCNMSTSYLPC